MEELPAYKPEIAVIGIACWYPDAPDAVQLWENIVARRRQFRRMPPARLPLADYQDPDPKAEDLTYGERVAVMDGFSFDWVGRRVPLSTYRSTDPVHWLALEMAHRAVEDAGLAPGEVPGERAGVLVGNSLTGEYSRAISLRARWPYVRRALRASWRELGGTEEALTRFEPVFRTLYKSPFPPVDEDTLAGGLSNTIAGRISNALKLHGGGYTVDGACASSLLAVATGATGLVQGDLDLALVGGVDLSLDAFELVGFAKTTALTAGDMTVYDRRGQGFIPGEGCGFAVLKRLDDARRDGDFVYAVLRGWGISSDGKARGITAPDVEGQYRSLKRAYERAGYAPRTLDFVEGHGTGTREGDAVELKAIARAMGEQTSSEGRTCAMTSLKSIVGHCKAAAGIGGFIKAVMAVNRRVVPPLAGCRDPHSVFGGEGRRLYPALQGEVRPRDSTIRAGVSAMGFGGINCHVTLESGDSPSPRLQPALSERALLVSNHDSELFLLEGTEPASLAHEARDLARKARDCSFADLTDLAAHLSRHLSTDLSRDPHPEAGNPLKAAVVASRPDLLADHLETLAEAVTERLPEAGAWARLPDAPVFVGNPSAPPRVGLLFPGQGSQRLAMARVLVQRHDWARERIEKADEWLREMETEPVGKWFDLPLDRAADAHEVARWKEELARTERAQPAVCLCSLLWLRWLEGMGLTPEAVAGHSLGELTAFHAAGAFDEPTLIRLAALRGRAMGAPAERAGSMASLFCSEPAAAEIRDACAGYLEIANINSPRQVVVSGEREAVEEAIRLASERGFASRRLAVSNAFHTRMVADAAEQLRTRAPLPDTPDRLHCALYTSTTGRTVGEDLSLREHFANQVLARVDFVRLVERMGERCDLFLEVGPGGVLSGLVRQMDTPHAPRCLPVEAEPGSSASLDEALAILFVAGASLRWERRFENRLVRPWRPPEERIFFSSPCEAELAASSREEQSEEAGDGFGWMPDSFGIPPERWNRYLRHRRPFLETFFQADVQNVLALLDGDDTSATRAEPSPIPAQVASPSGKPFPALPPHVDAEALLLQRVAETTGWPPEGLDLEMRFGEDLSLQSARVGDLVTTFLADLDLSGVLSPFDFANARLTDLLEAVRPHLPAETGKQPSAVETEPASRSERERVVELVLEIAGRITGFPPESIELEAHLREDLQLDSIKATELVAEAVERLNLGGSVDPQHLADGRLLQIVETLSPQAEEAEPETEPIQTPDVLDLLVEQASFITGFPRDHLDLDALVERDLNMGEEKLRRLLQRCAFLLDLDANLDLAPLRERTLRQIGDILGNMSRQQDAGRSEPLPEEEAPAWVRDFGVQLVEEDLPPRPHWWGRRLEDDWREANALVIHDESTADLADGLRTILLERGARAATRSYEQAHEESAVEDVTITHLFVLRPQQLPKDGPFPERLARMVHEIHLTGRLPPAADAPRRRTTLAFVQFGGGRFGRGQTGASHAPAATLAFASSLHLERLDLRVRVLDFAPGTAPEALCEHVLSECSTPAPFACAGYDFEFTRRVPRHVLLDRVQYTPEEPGWSSDDVFLVTGGGRGITASCALDLARSTGVRLALLGRTPLEDESRAAPVRATLRACRESGVTASYYSCDVTDARSVAATVTRVREELGPITGVIHGAGLNRPARTSSVTVPEALAEISPKVLGLQNVLDALESDPPRRVLGISSIIGITGMFGNAWYAFSNELMDQLLRAWHHRHPACAARSVAFSAWNLGMGEQLDAAEGLKRLGIRFIPTAEGSEHFTRLVTHDPGRFTVVVTARLAGLDTWHPPVTPPSDRMRFLERPVYHTAGVETVVLAHLDLERDPYLKDHVFEDAILLPSVFGLEAMAQAALHAAGWHRFEGVSIEDIRFDHPVTVRARTGADIRIRALVLEPAAPGSPPTVRAGVATSATGFRRDFFSATFRFSPPSPEEPRWRAPEKRLAIDPARHLYGPLLFQGPLFQRIRAVHALEVEGEGPPSAVLSTAGEPPSDAARRSFPQDAEAELVLGDPYLRDALLQSAQFLVSQEVLLPEYVAAIRISPPDREGAPEGGDTHPTRVVLDRREEDAVTFTVESASAEGLRERMEGLVLHIMSHSPVRPRPEELLQPSTLDRQELLTAFASGPFDAQRLPAARIHALPGLHELDRDRRHRLERPLLEEVAREAGAEAPGIFWDDAGRPRVAVEESASPVAVSLSHDDLRCLVVAGAPPRGCDLVRVRSRTQERWQTLLGPKGAPLLSALLAKGEELDVAGSRIWAANEAFHKAGLGGEYDFAPASQRRGVLLFRSRAAREPLEVATAVLQPADDLREVVALSLDPVPKSAGQARDRASPAAVDPRADLWADLPQARIVRDPDLDHPALEVRFPVTFEPGGNLSRTVYFSNFATWMGKVREIALWPVMPALDEAFSGGRWGMVTNESSLELFGDLTATDQVRALFWLEDCGGPQGSTTELAFQWWRLRTGTPPVLVGRSRQRTTWVELTAPGVAVSRPFPEFLQSFVDDGVPRSPRPHERPPRASPPELGAIRFRARPGRRPAPLVHRRSFQTDRTHANAVGNVYYATYYTWQGRVRDEALHEAVPDLLREPEAPPDSAGEGGEREGLDEPRTLDASVVHFAEAMPFDRVEVEMFLEVMYERGLRLRFEYWRRESDGARTRLAAGRQTTLWTRRRRGTEPTPAPLPAPLQRWVPSGRGGDRGEG